jgi:glycosyltransferase involved in cell wall biosynthesis
MVKLIIYNWRKMANIAFLGNFKVDYSTETHHVQTLESMGHKVYRLQEGQVNSEKIARVASNSDMFVWVHTHGWNTPGRMGMENVLNQLKSLNIPTLTYHLDLWFGLKRQDDLDKDPIYKNIGHFFTVDKLMADWFNENTNVTGHFLPAAVYDKESYIHKDYDGENFLYDVIFVGSKGYHPEYPYRPQLIDFLRETYGNRFLHVGGDGDTGTVRGDNLNQVYAKSKIAIGDTLNLNFSYPYYSSDRLFESTGRGGFTIYPRIEGITDWYEDGEEIVYYEHGNLQDLKSKIDYYLENEDQREAIRIAGHKNAVENHTYLNRWDSILKELQVGDS